ncbi:hypothetical protein BKP42_58290 [Rhodococcus erythropolis]|nr:hypothetical protein BKP42_58290 [Rhodococcus erythropolis]
MGMNHGFSTTTSQGMKLSVRRRTVARTLYPRLSVPEVQLQQWECALYSVRAPSARTRGNGAGLAASLPHSAKNFYIDVFRRNMSGFLPPKHPNSDAWNTSTAKGCESTPPEDGAPN